MKYILQSLVEFLVKIKNKKCAQRQRSTSSKMNKICETLEHCHEPLVLLTLAKNILHDIISLSYSKVCNNIVY